MGISAILVLSKAANSKSCFNPLFWIFAWLCLLLSIVLHPGWQEFKPVTAGYFLINSFGKSHRSVLFHTENRNNISYNSKKTNLGRVGGCWTVASSCVSSPRLSVSCTYLSRASAITTQGFLSLQCPTWSKQQRKMLLTTQSHARLVPKQPKVVLTKSLKNKSR